MITMHDLNSLYPGNWVSGECIDFRARLVHVLYTIRALLDWDACAAIYFFIASMHSMLMN